MIASNKIYTLTVAVGTRSSGSAGTISLKDNAWDGADLAAATYASPDAGSFTNRIVGFATTNGLHAAAVGHHLFIVLHTSVNQGAFDNVVLAVRRAAGVSLGDAPSYTNLATEGVLQVAGPLLSETDDLTLNAAMGSVVFSQSVPAPIYVMLWLTGGDAVRYSALAAELNTGGVSVLTIADNDWIQLAKRYSGFNMLVKFPGLSKTAFNWDFSEGCGWDGTMIDKVAVSTKLTSGAIILLQ